MRGRIDEVRRSRCAQDDRGGATSRESPRFGGKKCRLAKDAEACPGGDAMKLFGGRNRRHGHSAGAGRCGRPGQNFGDPADQVVRVCLGNFNAGDVAGFRDFSAGQFNVGEVQLPVDLRSHAFQTRGLSFEGPSISAMKVRFFEAREVVLKYLARRFSREIFF